MSTTRLHLSHVRFFGLLVLGMMLLALGLPGATTTSAAGNGQDYASDELGNPWDMSGPEDIAFEYTRDNGKLNNLTFSGGKLQGTATNNDPRVTLLLPTNPAANSVPTEGGYRPVNTSKYRYLTVRMTAPAATNAQVFWQATLGSSFNGSVFKPVVAGDQVITIDLMAEGLGRNGAAWNATSTVQGLYFDPGMLTGAYSIDYVRLSTSVPTAPDNAPPITQITSPSFISGPDYATTVLNNAWDMNDASDIAGTHDLNSGSISFTGGIFSATNVQGTSNCGVVCGDPTITLKTGTPINTGKFKYFTYRMQLDGPQDTVNGSVARLLWWTTKALENTTTASWVITEGFQTVSFDLNKILLEPSAFATWQNSTPIAFRFDPHEFAAPHAFHLDYVMLTGDSTANTSFNIRYASSGTPLFFADTDTNPNNGGGTAITCAANTAVAADAPNIFLPLILRTGATPPVAPAGSSCIWNTAGVAAGSYYIHTVTSDGIDSTNAYSQTPVVVAH